MESLKKMTATIASFTDEPLTPKGPWVMRAAVCLALLACWVLVHPYRGMVHDALLYTLQALSRLYPESLGQDLFLAHGSQEDFTIFSRIYAPLIRTCPAHSPLH
jgi:hypothetical protein